MMSWLRSEGSSLSFFQDDVDKRKTVTWKQSLESSTPQTLHEPHFFNGEKEAEEKEAEIAASSYVSSIAAEEESQEPLSVEVEEPSQKVGPEICCFFENLAVNYFTPSVLYSVDNFSNEQQMLGLKKEISRRLKSTDSGFHSTRQSEDHGENVEQEKKVKEAEDVVEEAKVE